MGEKTMVAKALTDEMIASGAELIQRLDQTGYSPDAALWLYLPDLEEWKLLLAEVKLTKEGPREAYRVIRESMSTGIPLKGLTLDLVSLAKPDAPLIWLLSSAIRTGRGIDGIRFTNNVINGTVIEDAYIYRLAWPPASEDNEGRAAGASAK